MLKRLMKVVCQSTRPEIITLTMTAELADVYSTKREGVNHILTQVESAFPNTPILVADVDATLRTVQKARAEPIKVAAANWAATGWLISKLKRNCIVIDVGSTTTSIIPIIEGEVSAQGKTDLEKLVCGELVYTGSLRTSVAAITNTVPVRGCYARVSSEFFAQSADVHLVLSNISRKEYTVDTADGKEKTNNAALARLARVVCADTEMLSEQEIVAIARYIYGKQVDQIAEALVQVCNRIGKLRAKNVSTVVTGLGRNFLARKASLQAGFSEVVDFGELVGSSVARVSTAYAVALMGTSHVEGR